MSLKTLPGQVPLPTAVAKRGDFAVQIGYADLAAGVSNTALAVPAFTSLANVQGLELDHIELQETFQDTSDTAHNSTSLTIGDVGSAARHLAATELNANGSSVPLKFGTATRYIPPADTVCLFTFTPTSGKNVANLNKGKLVAYFKLTDQRVVM